VSPAATSKTPRRAPKPRAPKRTVLFICHNHPAVRPGGAEAYALELHRYLLRQNDFDSVFLAKGGPPLADVGRPHLGTCIAPVNGSDSEYFLYTEDWNDSYDWTFGTVRGSKDLLTKHLRSFLETVRPDIVHLQHTMFFGYDALREIRNALPDVPIVYTLHEFMPICHRQGQMVRTLDNEPCAEESPHRCHECFPEISPQTFFLRKRFVASHFALVDMFIAPSRFLAERYVDWGIPREKIVVEDYGREMTLAPRPLTNRRHRDRFGFFGQLTPFKGIHILLEAMARLAADGEADRPSSGARASDGDALRTERTKASRSNGGRPYPHVRIHGANLDLQPHDFQERVADLLERARLNTTFVGRYDHRRLPALMDDLDWVVVPSLWWENSPLVIQEAFHFGRPVICSDIGGMAEKVRDGVDGLHFRAGDAASLADAIRRAATEPGLWERLRGGIRKVHPMERHVNALRRIYGDIFERRALRGS
jgi:glycosyltransferase involved in cell wall biosynthesis